jgi:DNA polymerase V
MYALVDCNNFYASCERVFRPELVGKPVVVLSLNDGCVIALSNEAKQLGLRVGAAYFENKKLFAQHGVAVFSANFPLYGNMSGRVMDLLGEFSDHVEIYSIDEAFLNLQGMAHVDLQAHAMRMRSRITQGTGIPICVGVAMSKTLAKAANRIAKKFPEKTGGVFVIDDHEKRIKALKWLKISDVWGIGRKHAKRLQAIDVQTAYQFTQLGDAWVQKNMGVVGLRLKSELEGIPQPPIIELDAKKNIATTRSFATNYTEFGQLRERVSTFAIACAHKLRLQHSLCSGLMVFIDTNRNREDLPQYSRSLAVNLPFATNSSIELSKFATQALTQIFKEGYHYKRAGVMLFNFSEEGRGQISLFHNSNPRHAALMQVLDKINHFYGQHTVKLASQDQQRMWLARQEMLSPSYATRLKDAIVVRA